MPSARRAAQERYLPRALRSAAVLIAVVAIVDPTVTTNRRSKPEVAVVAADSLNDRIAAQETERNLASSFTVVDAPFGGAAGTVVVGSQLPDHVDELQSPVFAVVPNHSGLHVVIESFESAPRVPLAARVPVVSVARVTGAKGRTVEFTLRLGELVVDRITRAVTTNDARVRIPMSFVPTATGTAPLRVIAAVNGSQATSAADAVVRVVDTRWPVLFFDPRPSWMSTFVRRTLERDARFVVTSRVTSSNGVSRDAGAPPSSLDDPAVRALFGVIVVGAPEALSDRDLVGLEAFLRKRGGAALLLFDQRAGGRYERLTFTNNWDALSRNAPVNIAAVALDSANPNASMRAAEWMWPTRLPAAAVVLAMSASTSKDSLDRKPVVWQTAVGAGRLVVSGALDAWKYRDPAQSGFESFWLTTLAGLAGGSPPPIVASVSPSVASPNEWVRLSVQLRDAALAERALNGFATGTPAPTSTAISNGASSSVVRASVSAVLQLDDSSTASQQVIRLWPDQATGAFHASFRAPATLGSHRLRVLADGNAEELPLEVKPAAAHVTPADSDLLSAWATASGGAVLQASAGRRLGAALERVIRAAPRRVSWHPMRSTWWLAPFALTLSLEWWLRRRRGLP